MGDTGQERLCLGCERVFTEDRERCPYDGSRLVRLGSGLPPGTVVDNRYTLVRMLGKGGMGTVYLARQHSMQRDVAIKVLHPRIGEDQEAVRRFFWEVRATSRLCSPHTITVFDFGQTGRGSLYFTMEVLRGTSLAGLMQMEGPLAPERALRIAIQITLSLEEAHAQHIVHRDLKPDNIMLDDRYGGGEFVKVLDFGIAKVLGPDGSANLTRTDVVFGTPAYMSPEQATGQEVDGRSDLYTLGVLLYEMLTGAPPFTGERPMDLLWKQVHEPARPLLEAAPHLRLPPALGDVVDPLLAKLRAERPASAARVRRMLEVALGDLGRTLSAPGLASIPAHRSDDDTVPQTRLRFETTDGLLPTQQAPPTAERLSGRDALRDGLTAALGRVDEGRVVALVGPAGAGKADAVAWILQHAERTKGARTVRLSPGADHDGADTLRQLLEAVLGTWHAERDGVRERLVEAARLSPQGDAEVLGALVALLRPPLAGEPAAGPPRPAVERAVVRVLRRLSARQPLVLAVERVDRATPDAAGAVGRLGEALGEGGAAVLLVLTAEAAPTSGGASPDAQRLAALLRGEPAHASQVAVGRLEADAMRALLEDAGCTDPALQAALLDLSGGLAGLARACWARVKGATEDRRRLVEAWRDGLVPAELLPSAAVAEVLAEVEARSAGLPDAALDRAVLQHAAVLGPAVSTEVLLDSLAAAGLAVSPEGLDAVLDRWVDAGLLVAAPEAGPDGVAAAHGVARAACTTLGSGAFGLRRLHRRAAQLLAARGAPDDPAVAARIASHHAAAGQLAEAVRAQVRAARAVAAEAHPADALASWQRARARLLELEAGGQDAGALDDEARAIAGALGDLALHLGHHDAALEAFEELAQLAARAGHPTERARALRGLARVDSERADPGSAATRLAEAARVFRDAGDEVSAAWCELERAETREALSDYDAAEAGYGAALAVFEAREVRAGQAAARRALGMLMGTRGDPQRSLAYLEQVLALQEELGDAVGAGRTLYDMAMAAAQLRRLDQAEELAHRALATLDAAGHRRGVSIALGGLSTILQQRGRAEEARPYLKRALRLRETLGDARGVANALSNLADVEIQLGDYEAAVHLALQARAGYAEVGDRRGVALAIANEGLALRALGNLAEAAARHREAVATYEALGQRDASLCDMLNGLATCALELGDVEEARAALERARGVARACGLTEALTTLERRIALLDTLPHEAAARAGASASTRASTRASASASAQEIPAQEIGPPEDPVADAAPQPPPEPAEGGAGSATSAAASPGDEIPSAARSAAASDPQA